VKADMGDIFQRILMKKSLVMQYTHISLDVAPKKKDHNSVFI